MIWRSQGYAKGVRAALLSALFSGLAPILGKCALAAGLPPLAVVALRTLIAAGLLLLAVLLYRRAYFYIYPAGLLGCLLAGGLNGLGSLFYYSALGRIDASLGHLLYSLYPLFLALWMWLDRQPPSRMALFRLSLALPAVFLLTHTRSGTVDLLGVTEMLVASALYALHLPVNQRVLYDMPAPTVTLYTLASMSAVVLTANLFFRPGGGPEVLSWLGRVPLQAWWPVLGLALVTFFARLTLFLGVKHLGGMQTALLGLGELLLAVILAQVWLGERLTGSQWIGAGLLFASLALVGWEKPLEIKRKTTGWLRWLSPSSICGDLPKRVSD